MPRPARILGDDLHYHVILRCNNGEYLLKNEDDFQQFLSLLAEDQKRLSFKLYNYTLMHSHIHLMMSTHEGHFINEIMHDFCLRYARDFNKRNNRSGHLWKNRYRCKLILNDLHALACLRYQHLNPVKANIVSNLNEWTWSGYSYYAYGVSSPILTEHPTYIGLADSSSLRRIFYQKFLERPLSPMELQLFEKRNHAGSKRVQVAIQKLMIPLLQEVSGSL